MCHARLLLLIPLLGAVSCGKSDSSRSSAGDEEMISLEVLSPPSGGEMLLVPAGEFTMGQADGRPDETPHAVRLSAFWIDRHPVTQRLYEEILGANPSRRKDPESPVSGVYWTDAARFCNRCSERDGLTPCYDLETWTCDVAASGYRLPTEAEWEYACRAGSDSIYFFGDDPAELPRFAWSKPHSRGRTHPVGMREPNRWGLHDMLGNVWEWTGDWYGETYYQQSPVEDPRGPAAGTMRVLRGGAWSSPPEQCRVAYRGKEFPVFQDACFGSDSYGFRRVRSAGGMSQFAARETTRTIAGEGDAAPVQAAGDGEKAPVEAAGEGPAAPVEAAAQRAKTDPSPPPPAQPVEGRGRIDASRLRGTIAFVSDRSGHLDIWTMRASGESPAPLTRDDHADADPRFSPDGQRLLYTTLRDGFPQVWLMKRDGSDPRKVTDGAQASWSPDGRRIAFIRDDQAWTRDLGSGEERRITPDAWTRCGTPAWSRDGARIAVASRHEGSIAIYLVDVAGKGIARLATEDASCTPHWSPDGRRILFQTVKGHIGEIGADGRGEEQLTYGADVQHEGRYSPDGSLVVFCRAPSPQGPWQICVLDLESDDLDFVQLTREASNSQPDWHALEN